MHITESIQVRNQIVSTIKIASRCGQAISMKDIGLLLPVPKQSKSIQEIIQNDPIISKSVSTENEFVVLKGYEALFSERQIREEVSKRYFEMAKAFADQLIRRSSHWKLMAVCGSVAYESAVILDDIDLFLITRKNRMWLCFLKALLLARVFNIKASLTGEKVNFCLSYVQDEEQFMEEILHHRTHLLAREFLSIRVLAGSKYYKSLLNKTSWIRDAFPRLHSSKITETSKNETEQTEKRFRNIGFYISNLLVYATLKSYLSLKAFLRNLKYRKEQKMKDVFEARITQGSSIYTSERYRELERMYDSMWVLR